MHMYVPVSMQTFFQDILYTQSVFTLYPEDLKKKKQL